jgi:hypothetical protein
MISVAFDDVRSRLFLFGCGVSLVIYWSGPVLSLLSFDVCFTLESGLSTTITECPLSANCGCSDKSAQCLLYPKKRTLIGGSTDDVVGLTVFSSRTWLCSPRIEAEILFSFEPLLKCPIDIDFGHAP